MKNKFKYIIIAFLVITCTFFQTQTGYASTVTAVLEINYAVNNNETPIEGATFSVVQIAEFDDSGIYTLNEAFKSTGYDPHNLDEDNLETIAEELYNLASNSDAITTGTTDTNGKCRLTLDKGLYLVWQSAKNLRSTRYYLANSSLVYVADAETVIYPKTSKKSTSSSGGSSNSGGSSSNNSGGPGVTSETVTTAPVDGSDKSIGNLILGLVPKTGDVREMIPVFTIAGFFICVIAIFVVNKRHKKNGEGVE